mmetsp:Transcript_60040/g.108066  ORF Transcript_60040/g.108066 Transcript_60040/m.108066 type:complete len:277 (+) Transcript_60040:639-1469(+)
MEPHSPGGHLSARQLHAVYTALLPGSDAHHHAVLGVANRVGLRVLDCNRSQDKVFLCRFGEGVSLRDHLRQFRLVEESIVPLLHEAKTAAHAELLLWWLEIDIGLQHDELPAFLRLQDLQSLRLEARRDDPVTHFDLQNHGCGKVDLVGDGHEVAEGAHGVSVACTDIRRSCWSQLLVLNLVDNLLLIVQKKAEGCSRRTAVLERGSRWQTSCLGQFVHKLPCVDGIEQVDVARRAGHHLEGEPSTVDGAQARWQLVRIAAILQRPLNLKGNYLLG